MTIYSGIFNSINGDRKYNAWWFAKYFATFIGNGVFPNPSTGLQVMADERMQVKVRPGSGWIDGYFLYSDDDYVLELDKSDGLLKRIDRIVMRLNHMTRQIEIAVKKGTFASAPVAPTLQRDGNAYELALADVFIANGATQITQANITDTRLNKLLCGIVKGTVDEIDTTDLFAQYDDAFKTWFDTIQGILDENVAASLASNIAELDLKKADKVSLETHVNNKEVHKTSKEIRSDSSVELRAEVVSSLPTSPTMGRVVFHNDTVRTPKFKGFDGGKWV